MRKEYELILDLSIDIYENQLPMKNPSNMSSFLQLKSYLFLLVSFFISFLSIPTTSSGQCENIGETVLYLNETSPSSSIVFYLFENPTRSETSMPNFMSGDSLRITCVDGNTSTDTIILYYISTTDNRDSFSVDGTLLNDCELFEITFPDSTVALLYKGDATESNCGDNCVAYSTRIRCLDGCLELQVLDDWGGKIELEPDVCRGCPPDEGYPIYDFGCLEPCRSISRTFHTLSCWDPLIINYEDEYLYDGNIRCDLDIGRAPRLGKTTSEIASVLGECDMVIHNIKITLQEIPRQTENIPADYNPFSLVGELDFPITLIRGQELPFEIKFSPLYSGDFSALVTICYENSCDCDSPYGTKQDGEHCLTSSWFDFQIQATSDTYCNDCNACITHANNFEVHSGGTGINVGCDNSRLFYNVGLTGEGIPEGIGDYCGQQYLDLLTGDIYVWPDDIRDRTEGSSAIVDQTWHYIPYGGYENIDDGCSVYVPPVPFWFLSYPAVQGQENNEKVENGQALYLISGYGALPQKIDLILNVKEEGCDKHQPGDIITIYQNDLGTRSEQPMESGFQYEFIACDGVQYYLKYIGEEESPYLSICDIVVAYNSRNIVSFFRESYRRETNNLNGCQSSYEQECEPIISHLLVGVVGEEDSYEICTQEPRDHASLENENCQYFDIGCTLMGETLDTVFSLLQCVEDRFFPRREEGNFGCFDEDLPYAGLGLGNDCTITIDTIIFIPKVFRPETVHALPPEMDNPFSTSATFPILIEGDELLDIPMSYTPTEPGGDEAYIILCYENSCGYLSEINDRNSALPELEFSQYCEGKYLVFPVEACAIEVSKVDENLDGEPEIEDPCACDDPENSRDRWGELVLFHDFVSVNGGNLTPTSDVQLEITAGQIYNKSGDPLPRDGDDNRIIVPYDNDLMVFHVDFWTEPGIGFDGQLWVDGTLVANSSDQIGGICTGPCAAIPTLGEWGIIILFLLLSIIGVSVAWNTKRRTSDII